MAFTFTYTTINSGTGGDNIARDIVADGGGAGIDVVVPVAGILFGPEGGPYELVGASHPLPVSGTFWQTTQPVSLASVPSHAVTNAGIFGVQLTEYTPVSGRLPTVVGDSSGAAVTATSAPGGSSRGLVVRVAGSVGVTQSGSFSVNLGRPGTATITSVAGSATNVLLLAGNSNRFGATIYNDSTSPLYIAFFAASSLSQFTVKVLAGGYYEVPFGFTGDINGIWESATGDARITEMTS
jgi:hypothetical protein